MSYGISGVGVGVSVGLGITVGVGVPGVTLGVGITVSVGVGVTVGVGSPLEPQPVIRVALMQAMSSTIEKVNAALRFMGGL